MGNSVIIAGSRSITDYDIVVEAIAAAEFPIDEVVSGRASGVDTLGEQWAEENDVPVAEFPYSDYYDEADKQDRKAPLVRNDAMCDYADALIAVWDGESSGTGYTISVAKSEGLDVSIYRTDTTRLDDF